MMLMGDEYGHTKGGNNNSYGHDLPMNNFDWNRVSGVWLLKRKKERETALIEDCNEIVMFAQLEVERQEFFRFVSNLIQFRAGHPLLGQSNFLSNDDVTWHEVFPLENTHTTLPPFPSINPYPWPWFSQDRWNDQSSCFLAFTLHDRGRYGQGDLYLAFNSHEFAIEAPTPKPPPGEEWYRIIDTNLESPRNFQPQGRYLPGLK